MGPKPKRLSIPFILPPLSLEESDYVVGKTQLPMGYSGSRGTLPVPIPEELEADFFDFEETRLKNIKLYFAEKFFLKNYEDVSLLEAAQDGRVSFRTGTGTTNVEITPDGDVQVRKDITAKNITADTTVEALNIEATNGVFENLSAVAKMFVIDHPDKTPNKVLRHGSLEGPENGVYFRTKGTVMPNIDSVIELPSFWKDLVDEESITIHVSPNSWIPPESALHAGQAPEYTVIVRSNSECYIDYSLLVIGTRKDVPPLIVEDYKE